MQMAEQHWRKRLWHLRHGGIRGWKRFVDQEQAKKTLTEIVSHDGPMLSIVIPAYNAAGYIEKCLRSVLSQQGVRLEVIVVDDGSNDGTAKIVRDIARHDSRVQLIGGENSGPAAARNTGVDAAEGMYLAFVDADDEVLPGAYAVLIDSLRSSGSDIATGTYVRMGTTGKSRPKLSARVHRSRRESISLAEAPELLEEPVLWNKVYRREFWNRHVSPMPSYANYEDQVPVYRALLAARGIDVLTEDVYGWRLAEGRDTRSRRKGRRADLRARMEVITELERLLSNAPQDIRERAYAIWMGRDLAMHAEFVPTASKKFCEALSTAAAGLKHLMPARSWRLIPAQERLLMWVVAAGRLKDIEEILGTRAEDTTAVPFTFAEGKWWVSPTYVPRLRTSVPSWLLEAQEVDFNPQAIVREVAWLDENTFELRGCAYIPGIDPDDVSFELAATGEDTVRASALPELEADSRIDVEVGDPWRSYAPAGFRARLSVSQLPAHFKDLELTATFKARGTRTSCPVKALAAFRICAPSPATIGGRMTVTSDEHDKLSLRTLDLSASPLMVEDCEFLGDDVVVTLSEPSSDAVIEAVHGGQGVPFATADGLRFRATLPTLPDRLKGGGERVWSLKARGADGRRTAAYFTRVDYTAPGTGRIRMEPDRFGKVRFVQRYLRVTVTEAGTDRDRLLLTGRIDPPQNIDIYLRSSSQTIVPSETRRHADGSYTSVFELAGVGHEGGKVALMSGGYHVRYGSEPESADGWVRAAGRLAIRSHDSYTEWNTLTVEARPSGTVAILASPPWGREERSKYGKFRLRERDWGPLTDGIVFETYNGKSTVDSPRVLFEEIRELTPELPLYWSIRDRTVEVPEGGIPIVEGTAAWHRAMATCRVWINNNNFPFYVRKRPGQFYLQTWHGTPIKKLLWDLPRRKVPLTYRRLMRNEVAQWDLLIAQSELAAANLCNGLGYTGRVAIMEYPRNRRLLNNIANPTPIKKRLGLGAEERSILYVPTWRNKYRAGQQLDWTEHLDLLRLGEATGTRVLVRAHHMARSSDVSSRTAIDVSAEPHVEDLMAVADILVTDYSSIAYDYKLTSRPILYYDNDPGEYQKERGVYDGPLCQDILESADVLATEVRRNLLGEMRPNQRIDEGEVRAMIKKLVNEVVSVACGKPPINQLPTRSYPRRIKP